MKEIIHNILFGLLCIIVWGWIEQKINPQIPMHDYQIQLVGSTLKLYDSARYVGTCNYYNTELEKLIINDNQ